MQLNQSRIRALTATTEALKPGLYLDKTWAVAGIAASVVTKQQAQTLNWRMKGKGANMGVKPTGLNG